MTQRFPWQTDVDRLRSWARSRSPSSYPPLTCPTIDEMLQKAQGLRATAETLRTLLEDGDTDTAPELVEEFRSYDPDDLLEALRSANSWLRERAEEKEKDFDDLQTRYDALDARLDTTQGELNEARQRISELEDELEILRDTASS